MQDVTYNDALVAIFESRDAAENARQELIRQGFGADQLEVTGADSFATDVASGNAGLSGHHHDASGGGIGGFFRRLFGAEEHHDREYYSRHMQGNRCAVVVHATGDQADRASDILNRSGAIEVQDESDYTEGSGFTERSDYADRSNFAGDRRTDIRDDVHDHLPVVEEEINVGKRPVQRGGVRVYSQVNEQPVEKTVNLREERVRVDRRPVDREATEADIAAADRGVIEVNETVEEPVVEKRARVVEEVHVKKDVNQRAETVRDTVRRSDVRVEDAAGRRDFGAADDNDPGYRYGYEMASDQRYRGRRWDDVENDLRTDYARRNPNSTWEETKAAVRRGWDKVTGRV